MNSKQVSFEEEEGRGALYDGDDEASTQTQQSAHKKKKTSGYKKKAAISTKSSCVGESGEEEEEEKEEESSVEEDEEGTHDSPQSESLFQQAQPQDNQQFTCNDGEGFVLDSKIQKLTHSKPKRKRKQPEPLKKMKRNAFEIMMSNSLKPKKKKSTNFDEQYTSSPLPTIVEEEEEEQCQKSVISPDLTDCDEPGSVIEKAATAVEAAALLAPPEPTTADMFEALALLTKDSITKQPPKKKAKRGSKAVQEKKEMFMNALQAFYDYYQLIPETMDALNLKLPF